MIRDLRIRGLGVIDDATVPFDTGLTVLTGETGAGKTMVLTGLALVMGEKADGSSVRAGQERAEVDATFAVRPDHPVVAVLDEAGATLEDDANGTTTVLVGRSVASEGRSRAFAGGRSVPAAMLATVGEQLVAVHGQSDQILLRDPRRQRDLLDRFAGSAHRIELETYREQYVRWRTLARAAHDAGSQQAERQREAALLRHGIAEIEAVSPTAGEDDDLKAQATALANATDLVLEVTSAHDLLAGSDARDDASALHALAQARRSLERAVALDPRLAPLVESLQAATDAVAAVSADLASQVHDLEADPDRLARVEERRHALAALKRAYGPSLDDVLAWWADAQARVAAAEEGHVAELERQAREAQEQVKQAAERISLRRREAAGRLATAVTDELHGLAMADAELRVEVTPVEPGPDGADEVAFTLRPHAGSDARPLGKGASGGELSRVMLALEVTLADGDGVPTFVFDEVDAGIGGRVAVEVGRRLARLALSSQVIVVTHLPQVAAFADRHVVVAKDSDGAVTASSVQVVEGQARVRELVRMLSGLEGSASGAEHAEELLELARRER